MASKEEERTGQRPSISMYDPARDRWEEQPVVPAEPASASASIEATPTQTSEAKPVSWSFLFRFSPLENCLPSGESKWSPAAHPLRTKVALTLGGGGDYYSSRK